MSINQVGKNEIKDKAISFEKLDSTVQSKINIIGNGNLATSNKTLIPAINELNSNTGALSNLKTSAKGSTVAAINELFQSGVDLQNIAKSALNAAGISYSNDQLNTLVQTMGSNLYTQDMKNRLANAITNAGGSANANDFNNIINGINNLNGQIRLINITKTVTLNRTSINSGIYKAEFKLADLLNIDEGLNFYYLRINRGYPHTQDNGMGDVTVVYDDIPQYFYNPYSNNMLKVNSIGPEIGHGSNYKIIKPTSTNFTSSNVFTIYSGGPDFGNPNTYTHELNISYALRK